MNVQYTDWPLGPYALPYSEWPLWTKALKMMAIPEDKGIGDVIARVIGSENSEAYKLWHRQNFGKECGCEKRQNKWNKLYPL